MVTLFSERDDKVPKRNEEVTAIRATRSTSVCPVAVPAHAPPLSLSVSPKEGR